MQVRSEEAEEPAALLVARRRAAFAGHQEVAVLIPVAAREVVAQHRRRLLGLALHAERQVALDQAMQRLGHVRGGLVALDHDAIAVDRADILLVASGSSGRSSISLPARWSMVSSTLRRASRA